MIPNWKPLETKLGPQRCAGFMYMGRVNGINLYKHGIARMYLNLDDSGACYAEVGKRRTLRWSLPNSKPLWRNSARLWRVSTTTPTKRGRKKRCARLAFLSCGLRSSPKTGL